jgi:hypothetical protein
VKLEKVKMEDGKMEGLVRNITAILFLLAVCLTASAQTQQPQLTQVPPKPTCNPAALPLFGGGPDCQDRWNLYNQAVQQRTREELQLYVDRQKELASAPLQQQIADLTKLSNDQQAQIKKLQDQMQADAAAALQAKGDAHSEGMKVGAGIGAGVTIALSGFVYGVTRLMATKKHQPQARAASAS